MSASTETGYPDRLAGDQIPLGARIIAVCDAFDAMVSDRPYRRALAIGEALRELAQGSGTQFDPAVVSAFLEAFAEQGQTRARLRAVPERPLLEVVSDREAASA